MTRPPSRPRLRVRLALLHAAFAFACGLVLVALADVPLWVGDHTVPAGPATGPAAGPAAGPSGARGAVDNLPELLRWSAGALVVVAALSLVIGWFVAGQALRPLRLITASARTLSPDDLDEPLRVPAAYRELTELAEGFDQLRRRLHAAFTAQRQFVANASHELRTPLAVQRTLLEVTLADPGATTEDFRAACGELLALGRRQEELIDALLTLARAEPGPGHREPFDLADLVRSTVPDRGAEGAARGVRITTALDPAPVSGDPRLAASLVANLVDNAVRHNVPGGVVEVTTAASGRLTVSNTGPRVPAGEIDRLFRPFQRLGPERTGGGHGLGLAIVAAIAQAHGAPVEARARPGGGLDVTVDFPRYELPSSRTNR